MIKKCLIQSGKQIQPRVIHLYLCDLDLECGVGISEVCFIVFDGLVPPVETISTAVTVPVCTFKPFFSFNSAHNLTMDTAAQHLQACP